MDTIENKEIISLWMMSKDEFNKWRRENDIPKLLKYFKENMPLFKEWQIENAIDDSIFLSSDRTSEFFIGSEERYLTTATGPSESGQIETASFVTPKSRKALEKEYAQWGKEIVFKVISSRSIYPYFYWLRKLKKRNLFRTPGDRNDGLINDFAYRMRQNPNSIKSRAFLFHNFPVLKLGGVVVTSVNLDERNLDFVDLDGLTVSRGRHGSRTTHITYSACNDITIYKTEKAFLTFEKCTVENLRIIQSRTQDIGFVDCQVFQPVLRGSTIFRTIFVRSIPSNITIENCDIVDLFVREPPHSSHFALSHFYKRLRSAYQQRGERGEAGNCFYKERFHEFLSGIAPFVPNTSDLPRRAYIGSYRDMFERWQLGQYSNKSVIRFISGNTLFYAKLLLPHYFFRLLLKKTKFIADVLDWSVWGFGERPARIFLWIGIVLAVFSCKYYFGTIPEFKGDLAQSFYCSAFNFSTMGCDKKSGIDAIEGLLGVTLMSIMVAGFANRSRY